MRRWFLEPRGARQASANTRRGHWKYEAFVIELGGASVGPPSRFRLGGGPPDERLAPIIENAARNLFSRIWPQRWEPLGSIIGDHLWRADNVRRKWKERAWSGDSTHMLSGVRLNRRRWGIP